MFHHQAIQLVCIKAARPRIDVDQAGAQLVVQDGQFEEPVCWSKPSACGCLKMPSRDQSLREFEGAGFAGEAEDITKLRVRGQHSMRGEIVTKGL